MKTIRTLALLFWLCSCGLAFAAEAKQAKPPTPPEYKGLKKRLGVLEVDVKVPGYPSYQSTPSIPGLPLPVVTTQTEALPGNIGAAMTEQLTTALVNTGRFIVLERKALQEVVREQDLGAAGRVSKETAAPVGELTGAEWLIKGAITEYEAKKSSTTGIGGYRWLGGIGAQKA